FAAERLLTAVWKAELETLYEDYVSGGRVDEEGLLTKTDIENIEREVFGVGEGRLLRHSARANFRQPQFWPRPACPKVQRPLVNQEAPKFANRQRGLCRSNRKRAHP